jgi:hypothetical protein
VDKESAVLSLPGTREIQIAIGAEHSNICRFASRHSEFYDLIEDYMGELAEYALKRSAGDANQRSPLSPSLSSPELATSPTLISQSRMQRFPGPRCE